MDRLFRLLAWVLALLLARRRAELQRFGCKAATRALEAREQPPATEPPWDPRDPSAPDWTLQMAMLSLPPSRHTRARRVRVHLWRAGWGQFASGRAGEELPAPVPLPRPLAHAAPVSPSRRIPRWLRARCAAGVCPRRLRWHAGDVRGIPARAVRGRNFSRQPQRPQ